MPDERSKVEAELAALREAATKALEDAGELRYWLDCYTDITDMRAKSSRAVKEWDETAVTLAALLPPEPTSPDTKEK